MTSWCRQSATPEKIIDWNVAKKSILVFQYPIDYVLIGLKQNGLRSGSLDQGYGLTGLLEQGFCFTAPL